MDSKASLTLGVVAKTTAPGSSCVSSQPASAEGVVELVVDLAVEWESKDSPGAKVFSADVDDAADEIVRSCVVITFHSYRKGDKAKWVVNYTTETAELWFGSRLEELEMMEAIERAQGEKWADETAREEEDAEDKAKAKADAECCGFSNAAPSCNCPLPSDFITPDYCELCKKPVVRLTDEQADTLHLLHLLRLPPPPDHRLLSHEVPPSLRLPLRSCCGGILPSPSPIRNPLKFRNLDSEDAELEWGCSVCRSEMKESEDYGQNSDIADACCKECWELYLGEGEESEAFKRRMEMGQARWNALRVWDLDREARYTETE